MVNKNTFAACAETLKEYGNTICIEDEQMHVGGQLVTHVSLVGTWDNGDTIKLYNGDPTDEDSTFEEIMPTEEELNSVMQYVIDYF